MSFITPVCSKSSTNTCAPVTPPNWRRANRPHCLLCSFKGVPYKLTLAWLTYCSNKLPSCLFVWVPEHELNLQARRWQFSSVFGSSAIHLLVRSTGWKKVLVIYSIYIYIYITNIYLYLGDFKFWMFTTCKQHCIMHFNSHQSHN